VRSLEDAAAMPERPMLLSLRVVGIVVALGLGIGLAVAAFLAVVAAKAPDARTVRIGATSTVGVASGANEVV
jgi:hypothetical protein